MHSALQKKSFQFKTNFKFHRRLITSKAQFNGYDVVLVVAAVNAGHWPPAELHGLLIPNWSVRLKNKSHALQLKEGVHSLQRPYPILSSSRRSKILKLLLQLKESIRQRLEILRCSQLLCLQAMLACLRLFPCLNITKKLSVPTMS